MLFLVRIAIDCPREASEEERSLLVDRESARARELADSGHLVRLWRTEGGWGNVGLWAATDASELRTLLCSLPLHRWMRIDIERLLEHPSDPGGESTP